MSWMKMKEIGLPAETFCKDLKTQKKEEGKNRKQVGRLTKQRHRGHRRRTTK